MIFEKLQQGCAENEELLTLAMARAEAENVYGSKLLEIRTLHAPKKEGFDHDEGATVRKAYEGIVNEMGEEGKHHLQVAESIRVMVLNPFRKWTDEHKTRVEYSGDFLRSKVKVYEQEAAEADKIKRKYFSKCRALDEARDSEPKPEAPKTPKDVLDPETPKPREAAAPMPLQRKESVVYTDQKFEPVELGGEVYAPMRLKTLLYKMLKEIPQKEVRVPIMGTYEHVSTGADIVSWLQKYVTSGDLAHSEQFGQDLVGSNYLRLVGQVGSKFLNSTQLNYQWKKLAFVRAGLANAVPRDQSLASSVGEYFGTINNYLNNQFPDETPLEKLEKEAQELDVKYKESVTRFDDARCSLEASIVEHLNFMERCETDRLKAIKQVLLDLVAPVSNVMPSIQASVDKFLLYQETVKPERDLLYLVESYKTGGFAPKVPVYDNYYNPSGGWTFGVDLEHRARGDGKRAPLIISTIFRYFDDQYPELENDHVRLAAWTDNAPLNKVHELRKEINTGAPPHVETLKKYDPTVVAGVLKLYFKELPESVIPNHFYDSLKNIYVEHGNEEDPTVRIKKVQTLCGQLRLTQLAALDAITKHFGRLLEIANPSQEDRENLYLALAPCVLRPQTQSALSLVDKHPQKFVRDLIEHRKTILSELKRAASSGSKVATKDKGTHNEAGAAPVLTSKPPREDAAPASLDAEELKVRPAESTDA